MKIKKNTTLYIVWAWFFLLTIIIIISPLRIYGDEPEIGETALNSIFSYKLILHGNLSILEPSSYLYGSIYSYILFPAGLVISKIVGLLTELDKIGYYKIFRISNLTLAAISGIFFIKLLKSNVNKELQIFSILLLLLNPIFISRSLFLNQDILSICLMLWSLLLLSRYFKDNKNIYLLYFYVTCGFLISSKITYLFPVFFTYIYIILRSENKLKFILYAICLIPIAYFVSFPFSVINFNTFITRILQLRTLEAGIAIDSYHPSPIFYIARIVYFYWPILLLGILNYKKLLGSFKEKVKEQEYLTLLIYFVSIIVFFSLQVRKTDRWGIPIYVVFLLLYIPLLKNTKYLVHATLVAIIWLGILNVTLISFFIQMDPRIILKSTLGTDSKNNYLVISEHGNMEGLESLGNTEIFSHRVYEVKDGIENYSPKSIPLGSYKYIVLSNGVIRDFSNTNNYNKFESINEWNRIIRCVKPLKNIGAKKIAYEPQIGFSVYKFADFSECKNIKSKILIK